MNQDIVILLTYFIIYIILIPIYLPLLIISAINYLLIYELSVYYYYKINNYIAIIFYLPMIISTSVFCKYHIIAPHHIIANLKNEKAIIISNHWNTLDGPIIAAFIYYNSCIGILRFMLKQSLIYIPFLFFSDNIFLAQDINIDEDIILTKITNYRNYNEPINMFLLPEGHRMSKKHLEKSQKYQKKENLPITEYVIQPKTRGLELVAQSNCFEYIYDITLYYKPSTKIFSNQVYIDIEKFDINAIADITEWCKKRFLIKDEKIKYFNMKYVF